MANSSLKKAFLYIKINGLYSFFTLLAIRLRISPNGILQRAFKFNRWHINPYSGRPYAQAVVAYLNKRNSRNSILEIGCGLGDILRRLDYKIKTGLDREQAVLNAAEFVIKFRNAGGGTVRFSAFDLLEDELVGKFDAIVMVNWIHEIPPSILIQKFNDLFNANLNPDGELIFDVLDNPDYKYNHKYDELTSGIKADVSLIGHYEYNRNVYSAKKPIR